MIQEQDNWLTQLSRGLAIAWGDNTGRTVTRREADGFSRLTNGAIAGKSSESTAHAVMLATAWAGITKNKTVLAIGVVLLIAARIYGDVKN